MEILSQMALMALAALFEVAGDALIRRGLDARAAPFVAAGFAVLGTYGVIVNLVRLDFARLLGAYVAWFALASVLFGRFVFRNRVTAATWVWLALVFAGSAVIQFGSREGAP